MSGDGIPVCESEAEKPAPRRRKNRKAQKRVGYLRAGNVHTVLVEILRGNGGGTIGTTSLERDLLRTKHRALNDPEGKQISKGKEGGKPRRPEPLFSRSIIVRGSRKVKLRRGSRWKRTETPLPVRKKCKGPHRPSRLRYNTPARPRRKKVERQGGLLVLEGSPNPSPAG